MIAVSSNEPINIRTGNKPEKAGEVLSNPRRFTSHNLPVSKQFDEWINESVTEGCKSNGRIRFLLTSEIKALLHSLTDADQEKLANIIKAIKQDKTHHHLYRGMIFGGGEIRVVPEVAGAMIINTIAILSGLKKQEGLFNRFYGCSAGAMPAGAMAMHGLNSQMLDESTKTQYGKFYMDRPKFEHWINKCYARSFASTTGRAVDIVTGHHLEELGTEFDVCAGKMNGKAKESTMLLKLLRGQLGIETKNIPLAKIGSATANLPCLFYYPWDRTFGNCVLEEGKDCFFDAGLIPGNDLPLDPIREEVEQYRVDRSKLPSFYFLIGNQAATKDQVRTLRELGGREEKEKNINPMLLRFGSKLLSLLYMFSSGNKTLEAINDLGIDRAYIEVSCAAIDPNTNKIEQLKPGNINARTETKKTLLLANIPTKEFREMNHPFETVIDQLHSKLIDASYINSHGQLGKSPYDLYLSDIDSKITLPQTTDKGQSRNVFLGRAAAAL
jgi:hypothetical protein